MDRPRQEAENDRPQSPDPGPSGELAGDLGTVLSSLDERLTQLDQTSAAFEQRLRAIEERLHLAASPVSPPASASATPAARRSPAAPPPVTIAPPRAEPIPASGGTRGLLAAAQALLDGEPSSRQPRDQGGAAIAGPRGSVPMAEPPAGMPRRRRVALEDLERAVSGRGLAWVGGLTLLLGALFFLSLAISRGWIGPEARVVIGLIAGIVVTVLGDRLMRGGDRVLGPVLVAVGIGIWNLALVAGTRLYDFVPLWTALLGTAAGALVATAIAIRANAQVIALYGVVTALAAPMLFAVPAARMPMAYLTIVLAGSTAIALARGWAWLPPVAFVLSEIQLYAWWLATDAAEGTKVLAIASISLLHLVAATGIGVRAHSGRSRLVAVGLLLLNALAYSTLGFGTLTDERIRLGVYLLGAVAAHVAVAWSVLRVQRADAGATFARVAFGIAVTLLTIVVPVVFDGPLVAMAWAAEALALAWLANRYRNGDGFLASAIVFGLAVWHLFSIEYGASRLESVAQPARGMPFVNDAGLTLLALLAALAVAGVVVRQPLARMTFSVIGFGLLIAALPYELSHLWLLAGWALLAVLALGAERFFTVTPDTISLDRDRAWFAANGLKLAAAIAGALAIHRAVAYEMPVLTAVPLDAGIAYVGQPVAAAAIIILAALAAMAVTSFDEVRAVAGSVAMLITAHLAAFELDPAPAVAVWAVLAVGAWALQQRSRGGAQRAIRVYLATSALLLAVGVAVTFVDIAPPARLLVSGGAEIDHPFLWSEATLALGALSAAFFVIARGMQGTPAGGWLALGGGVLALYLVSIGIVDEFQRRVGVDVSVDELRRQSQVALSVVWAVLGGVAVAVGLVRTVAPMRWFGLGLLALATVKVFLFDLAALDAVYRVMSFIVLGILLLLSSYAYRRLGTATDHDVPPSDGFPPSKSAGELR